MSLSDLNSLSVMDSARIEAALAGMTPKELNLVMEYFKQHDKVWEPLPGPQTMAFQSDATIVGYGGAAGGGKTDLACGVALLKHKQAMIFRRESTQLTGIIDRLVKLVGHRDGYNGQDKIWRLPTVQIEFASVQHAGDETKYQGRPHDLIVFDEAANFLEHQVKFLLGWLRTTERNQKCQALLTFNPPTTAEGRWVIPFFAPWIDTKHPNPARDGEIRWFAAIDGKDVEVPNGESFVHGNELIKPLSRTFIRSRVTDNPYLLETGYMSMLQSLPEPLRSQMLNSDFTAGMEDDQWQVIPTAWVELAMSRWKRPDQLPPMTSIGVDVARGGKDSTVIARRHGMWFDQLVCIQGENTNDGPKVAGQIMAHMRDGSPIHLDVIGVGSSPYDFLNQARQHVIGVNVSERSLGHDKSGRLSFPNQRSEYWWKMREALDPSNNTGIALPDDPILKADLCAPKWKNQGPLIKVESREEIFDRIKRSPDRATAVILALIETPKIHNLPHLYETNSARDSKKRVYDPYERLNNPRSR